MSASSRGETGLGPGLGAMPPGPVAGVSVPRRWSDCTPEWMTTALARRFPTAEVSAVEVVDIDDGTTSRARLRLTYRGGDGPESVFVKRLGSLSHRLLLAFMCVVDAEAKLLRRPDNLPLETAAPVACGLEPRRMRAVVVLEDLACRGAIPNYSSRPLPPESVATGVDGLARLHALHWGLRQSGERDLAWLPVRRWIPSWLTMVAASNVACLKRAGTLLSGDQLPAHLRSARRLSVWWARAVLAVARGERTLLHGDPHVCNSYRLPGGQVGFFDWQAARAGSWEHDFGYFVVSALTVEQRRTHERDLLARYIEALHRAGGPALSFDEAWLRYRATPAYGLPTWVMTLGLGRAYHRDENSIACVERFAAAFDDLETATVFP